MVFINLLSIESSSLKVLVSQIFIVLSLLPLTIFVPSGLNLTENTESVWSYFKNIDIM